jgi:hypothetical protein
MDGGDYHVFCERTGASVFIRKDGKRITHIMCPHYFSDREAPVRCASRDGDGMAGYCIMESLRLQEIPLVD